MSKNNTENILERLKTLHNNFYSYPNFKYNELKDKIKIKCPKHGIFETSLDNHLYRKSGCRLCANEKIKQSKLKTKENFIIEANKIHNNKYNYDKFIYEGNKIPSIIICPIHGKFNQTAQGHIIAKHECPKCGIVKNALNRSKSNKQFILDSKKLFKNKFDYTNCEYKNHNNKVKINCKKHGEFSVYPDNHLKKTGDGGCQKCRCEKLHLKFVRSKKEFTIKANKIHNCKYNYKLANYINSRIKIKIICKKHGEFFQTPRDHLTGQGCPNCKSSINEQKIENILNEYNINHTRQKLFEGCKGKRRKLPFDFYLIKYNICIEYDGIQHYKLISYFGGKKQYNNRKLYDKIKNNYCKNNNIKLYRITYKDDVEIKMKEIIDSLKTSNKNHTFGN